MIAEEESAGAAAERENYFAALILMMAGLLFVFILALVTFALDFRLTTDAQENAAKVAQDVAAARDTLQSEAQATKRPALSAIGEEPRRGLQDIEERQRAGVEKAAVVKPRSQRRVRSIGPGFGDRLLGLLRQTFAGAKGG